MFLQMILNQLNQLKRHEEGQGLIEYALIVLLIAIVAIVAMQALGVQINGVFDSINNTLGNQVPAG